MERVGDWPTVDESAKDAPERLDVLLVAAFGRRSRRVDGHAVCMHHGLKAALGAEAVQLIGVRPTPGAAQQFRVLPVAEMGVREVCGEGHGEDGTCFGVSWVVGRSRDAATSAAPPAAV